jgi:preprotein translocase subunit YajC
VSYAATGSGSGGSVAPLLLMVLLFGAMYFLFIRPNKRRRQQQAEMQSAIGPGDEVLTIGGLYGVVEEIDDDVVVLEVAPGVTNRYVRQAINKVVNAADRPELDDDEDVADDDEAESTEVSLDKKAVESD